MTSIAEVQSSLEATLKEEILRMYEAVANEPDQDFHFYHGREAAEAFDYDRDWLDRAPPGAVASFAGVGNPHKRAEVVSGETVLEVGSGAGLDAIVSSWRVGQAGTVIGVDVNETMLEKARDHAAEIGASIDFRAGLMENMPVEDETIDVVTSNGVINLSFRKRRVIEEMFRVLKPGGRMSITDIVSAVPLSQSIVNDPKLWAS